ncbi:hypothetical protein J6590_027995 [Homalodisca vitripennis]|nr:hypothetical protein J6590_027995 [Homalodisca vitripennis]
MGTCKFSSWDTICPKLVIVKGRGRERLQVFSAHFLEPAASPRPAVCGKKVKCSTSVARHLHQSASSATCLSE